MPNELLRYRAMVPATAMLLATLTAMAAFSVPAAAAPLEGLSIVLVYDSSTSDTPLLGVTGRLPDGSALPSEMILPVPDNPNVMWSGEYFPEDIEKNTFSQAALEVRNGVPAAVMVLRGSRIGHAEMTYQNSSTLVNEATGLEEVGFEVILPVDSGPVYAAIAVPPTLEVLAGSTAVEMSREPDGLTYYSINLPSASAGDTVALSLQVRGAAPPEMHNEPAPWMTAVIGVIIVSAALLLVYSRRRRSNPA